MREEKDYLGKVEIEDDKLYGISSYRAHKLFPETGEKFDERFIWAYFMIKKAAATLNKELGYLDSNIADAIISTCDEWKTLKDHIIVDPLSGGAGTSVNMNINEVIANRASQLLNKEIGYVKPIEHVNLHQSTNDTFVTAGKIAIIVRLRELIDQIIKLQEIIQAKEKEFYRIRKVGRTQLMDGPPIMLGQEFGAWADALARDRWRLNKVEERIRNVNIGGTAIGTGIGAPKNYVLKIVNVLREICNVKIAKADNLIDATQNMDVFSEIHGLLKALSVNLYKISNDIRLLSSGPNTSIGELILPKVQIGSSIMPGKNNPVVPEYVMQISLVVFSHDSMINHASALGNLELNQFSPLIVHYTLKSINLFKNACYSLSNYIENIKANEERCRENLEKSISNLTPLINIFGYNEVSQAVKESNYDVDKAIKLLSEKFSISVEDIKKKINPDNLTKLGF
ncbi:aspartate ammonia-lyase [Thermosipho sp. (in: thermotogales)]|jgi:aspartate ammonia-lyase|uniref:aspartate ammonia-lyase n=1 Tax=Thermosipho sp. (in: thermotogales) TaxID=1968895 RepID=UPI002580644C|nr:aspartate ammonia-lyase [Thermosipho sp. (in: thermotogales)]MBZ4650914.1 aspartate ammonia-lyase [Thermosipho sp. (in: thermotogales)]